MSTGRNTTIRDRHRTTIARDEPPCAYSHCLFPGQPIEYAAHHLDPKSFTVDHIIPLNKGGSDTLDNKQAMHRACNRHKSDRLAPPDHSTELRVHVTDRNWWAEA